MCILGVARQNSRITVFILNSAPAEESTLEAFVHGLIRSTLSSEADRSAKLTERRRILRITLSSYLRLVNGRRIQTLQEEGIVSSRNNSQPLFCALLFVANHPIGLFAHRSPSQLNRRSRSRSIDSGKVSRSSTNDTCNAEVIKSGSRFIICATVVTPQNNNHIVAFLDVDSIRSKGLPSSLLVQCQTAIQSDASGRQSLISNTGRQCGTCCKFNISRNEGYTHIIPQSRSTLTLTSPVVLEGISTTLEMEQLGCIYNCSTVRVGIRGTTIIRDIECVRTLTVVSSRTIYPSVSHFSVNEEPLISILEVICICVTYLRRHLFGLEGKHNRFALIFLTAIFAQIEIICRTFLKTLYDNRVLSNNRVLSRCLTSSNTCILPAHTILIVIPREGCCSSRDIRNAQTLRHTASQTTDLEVINCTRSVTRIRVISPYDNNFMVASLRYFNLAQLTLPIRLSAQFATAIQCNPTIR